MKIIEIVSTIALATAAFNAFAQDFNSPGAYSKYITEENHKFSEKMLDYTTISTHSDRALDGARALRLAIQQLESSLNKMEKLGAYKGDMRFRNEALSVFKQYKTNLEADFSLVETLQQGSQNSYEAMEKYFKASERAQKKLHETYEKLDKAQEEFAKRNNIILTKSDETNEFATMVREINGVEDYTHKIYLACFRVSKAESAFMAQMANKTPNANLLDRRRTELAEAAKLAEAQLDTVPKKYPDDTYRDAVKKKITFFKEKADKDFVEVARIQKLGAKRTKEDVDMFNKIVDELNTFSQANTKEINETQAELKRKHIPKPKIATKRM